MNNVFNNYLTPAQRSRALFAAVGKEDYAQHNNYFCKGSFAALVSTAWWQAWGVVDRDIVTMQKDSRGVWTVHCRFNMNDHTKEDLAAVVIKLLGSPQNSNAPQGGSSSQPQAGSATSSTGASNNANKASVPPASSTPSLQLSLSSVAIFFSSLLI